MGEKWNSRGRSDSRWHFNVASWELLDKQEANFYRKARGALESGFELEYSEIAQIISEDTLSPSECRFVWDVMTMYETLQRAHKKPQGGVPADARDFAFPGFDGNNEGRYWSYAQYIVDDKGRYEHLKKTHDLNSHFPSVETYERMLEAWVESKDKFDLTTEDVKRIIDARVHPSNR